MTERKNHIYTQGLNDHPLEIFVLLKSKILITNKDSKILNMIIKKTEICALRDLFYLEN